MTDTNTNTNTNKPKRMTKAERERQEREEVRQTLRSILDPGDRVYCVLRHVSRSGMSRRIDLYKIDGDELRWLSALASRLIGWNLGPRADGIKVQGCGMDMGFHLVYTLGALLWPDGTPEPHGSRNGEPDSEGGYALKAVWL